MSKLDLPLPYYSFFSDYRGLIRPSTFHCKANKDVLLGGRPHVVNDSVANNKAVRARSKQHNGKRHDVDPTQWRAYTQSATNLKFDQLEYNTIG
jgi:hypothetical protein